MMCSLNYLLWVGTSFFRDNVVRVLFVVFGTFIGMIGISIISNSIKIMFVKEIDPSLLARMSGMFNSIISLGSPILATCLGVVVIRMDIIDVLFICFVMFFTVFFIIYVYQIRHIHLDLQR